MHTNLYTNNQQLSTMLKILEGWTRNGNTGRAVGRHMK